MSLRPERLAICRVESDAPVLPSAPFWAICRRDGELTLVLPEELAAPEWRAERGFRALVVDGSLDFALVGILARLSGALASAGVSLFALSTFDTDVLLVRDADLDRSVDALRAAGIAVSAGKGNDEA